MAQQKINLGTQGNDGTGDAIRVAFSKVNDNFGELYGNTTGLIDVANDTTPQLGGNLDINGKSIVSVSNASINILPNGTGSVILDKVKITDSAITPTLTNTNLALAGAGTGKVTIHGLRYPTVDGAASQVLQTDGSGNLSWVNNAGGGGGSTGDLSIIGSTISGPSNAYVNIFPGGSGAVLLDGIRVQGNTITSHLSSADLELSANGSGRVTIHGLKYPGADGSADHYLKTDGSGTLSFASIPANQNLWATVSGDSGTTTANTTTDTLTVAGNTGITTAVSGDTLTITGPNLSSYLTSITGQTITSLSDVTAVTSGDDGKILYYDHSTTSFKWKTDASAPANTDAISEGSTNLYYTDARFDTRLATKDTANLTEGSNLYYTNARADARIGAASINALSDVDTTGVANGKVLKYNSTSSKWEIGDDTSGGGGGSTTFLGLTDTPSNFTSDAGKYLKINSGETAIEFDTLTTADVTEGANLYYTDARFDTRLATKTTANLTEGANLYFTNARADARITNALKDEDNMASDSATHVPSQQSVKAYVDSSVSGISSTSLNTGAITYDDNEILGTRSNENILITPNGTGKVIISALESSSMNAPSSLSGTYSITSPTTITLNPTSEIINLAPMKLLGKTATQLGSFVASSGSMVAVSDQGYKPAYYDGSNWKYIHNDANV